MSFGGGDGESSGGVVATFKNFVSEETLEEKRRERQAEWEKVRKPDDPVEAPEPEYDNRCLYDRLEENKRKKEEEIEEKTRLANQVTGIDEDEAQFLDFVSQRKSEMTKALDDENEAVLQEYRDSVVSRVADTTTKAEKKPVTKSQLSKAKSQQALLAGAVKRKSTETDKDADSKKRKSQDDEAGKSSSEAGKTGSGRDPKLARIIGVLPGLGAYSNSSDSESSSDDSDIEHDQRTHQKQLMKQCQHQQAGHH